MIRLSCQLFTYSPTNYLTFVRFMLSTKQQRIQFIYLDIGLILLKVNCPTKMYLEQSNNNKTSHLMVRRQME